MLVGLPPPGLARPGRTRAAPSLPSGRARCPPGGSARPRVCVRSARAVGATLRAVTLWEEDVETDTRRRSHSDAGGLGDGLNGLRERGFARYGAEQLGIVPTGSTARDLAGIREVFTSLPPDPYAPGTNRFRRYSHAVYLPWKDELSWIPGTPDPVHGTVTDFSQGDDDPAHPRTGRVLPGIPEALRGNALLLRLLRWDIDQVLSLKDLGRRPLWAGVHLIKLGVDHLGQDAVSSRTACTRTEVRPARSLSLT